MFIGGGSVSNGEGIDMTQEAAQPFIACENLVKIYKIAAWRVALGGSMQVPRASCSPSSYGSGKSALMNIWAG